MTKKETVLKIIKAQFKLVKEIVQLEYFAIQINYFTPIDDYKKSKYPHLNSAVTSWSEFTIYSICPLYYFDPDNQTLGRFQGKRKTG